VTTSPQLLTGVGCAELQKRGFSLELSAPFGVRQCDDSFCTMLPARYGLENGAFRSADFLVTDVLADEAIFDLGILRGPLPARKACSPLRATALSASRPSMSVRRRKGCGTGGTWRMTW